MDDVREKLVELLNHFQYCGRTSAMNGMKVIPNEEIADHLIAHGVTVQECGEWVYDRWCEFKCSVCGEFSNSKPYRGKENYCPNCGANMKMR